MLAADYEVGPLRRSYGAVVIQIEALPSSEHGTQAAEGSHRRVHKKVAFRDMQVLAEGVGDAAAQAPIDLQRTLLGEVAHAHDVRIAQARAGVKTPLSRAADANHVGAHAKQRRFPWVPRHEAAALSRHGVSPARVQYEAMALARCDREREVDRAFAR